MSFKNLRDAVLRTATVLLKVGPSRQKRLSCIASLGAYLRGEDKLDKKIISKLNQVMALGTEEGAFTLPVYLNKVIWNGVGQEIDLSHAPDATEDPVKFNEFIDKIMQAMPEWLRYGEDSLMREEVSNLVAKRHEVLGIAN